MKSKVVLGVRVVLGLLFVVFGANFFLQFLPNPTPTPEGGQFLGALFATGYMFPLIKVTEIVAGLLILTGIAVPLGLVLLAPIVVNIVLFHTVLSPGDYPLLIVITGLGLFLAWSYGGNFKKLFSKQRIEL